MAFYTSRIGGTDSETEIRHSARSLASSISGSGSRYNLSSRSYDTNKSSVRYINSAAYIENSIPFKDVTSDDNLKLTSGMSETQSDIVPPLDLKSEENYPTTRDYTFSYRKHCEAAKIVFKPDQAYETWLSAKRKLISDEAARRKKVEEQKQKELEERKRLAQEKYEKWLDEKLRSQQPSQSSLGQQSTTTTKSNTTTVSEMPRRSQISDEEARARLEDWEHRKRLEIERRRMLKRQEEERRREQEEQRRQMAAEAWEKWIADAAKKPKPVPLNRGIFTLRGTVSDIFVNPNEWKPIVPVNDDVKK